MHPINNTESYKKMSETKREQHKKVAEVNENKKILHIWRSIADCAEEENLDAKKVAACCRGELHSTQNRIFYWLDEKEELIIPIFKGESAFNYKGKKGTTQKQKTNRKVAQIDLKTKEILNVFDSIALASRETNCDGSAISKVCRGIRNKTGGFFWKYVD